MHISAESLDDLMHAVFEAILKDGEIIKASKGENRELFGVLLELKNPLARISRSEIKGRLYSALGELFWYLAGSNELAFIDYYLKDGYKSDDGTTVWGAYGPRLFNMQGLKLNQVNQVVKLLREKKTSRQAVIQLFDAADISDRHGDTPCTCTLQFLCRTTGLDMFVSMRSNDAYKGLPHDIFAFTMIQELIARELGVPIGRYKHVAGSLHIYREKDEAHPESDEEKATLFLEEGWQSVIPMDPMPSGNQWGAIEVLKEAEARIRKGEAVDVESLPLDPYWLDIARALQIFAVTKAEGAEVAAAAVAEIAGKMSNEYFRPYIRHRQKRAAQ